MVLVPLDEIFQGCDLGRGSTGRRGHTCLYDISQNRWMPSLAEERVFSRTNFGEADPVDGVCKSCAIVCGSLFIVLPALGVGCSPSPGRPSLDGSLATGGAPAAGGSMGVGGDTSVGGSSGGGGSTGAGGAADTGDRAAARPAAAGPAWAVPAQAASKPRGECPGLRSGRCRHRVE